MQPSLLRSALVLGLLGAVGPFAIDMYLPAMPTIAADLDTSVAATQSTLTAYFIAFGLAQLVYGPWADQAGRKLPLYFGVSLFLLASLGAWRTDSIAMLTALRAVQGLGAAVLMVVPRAIIRDMHTGAAATRLMALVMLVISVSPMLAPLAGSGVIALWGWRAIFLVLAIAAAASLTLTATLQPETLPPERRLPIRARTLLSGARALLCDARFMGLTFLGGFGMASFFVFIATASFVYTGEFGLSPTGFSIAFALNAVGFFSASQMAGPLAERFGIETVVRAGTLVFALAAGGLLLLALAGQAGLTVTVAGLFLGNAGLGVVIPTTMVLALDDHGENAGLASSLGGTLQMLAGGVMIGLTGPFFDGTVVPMIASIAVCAGIALVLSRLTLRRRAPRLV
ncbi:multidrug effflux MFS transporter [Frigidibacter sp. ROC022]|uniref:multidrug effflux MFS transporter n=1 Tax=Frigidibacter sp. ROC022 TaxID=2971796 RepID=UPI00215A5477|nr:multidrug effflux MFS transporter [Frigidibacter sp. ROC022]MCR8725670.1 multidrug effflux MFS transporter [Frigidibacter sp. ROC022]